ncbi:MAG TPA: hypothetical protein VEE84_07125 [Burkholderiaceae bacterium]|nr:hypothetical protein [Burkholderiaceae bacterium]
MRAVRSALEAVRDAAQRAARQGADYLVAENPTLLGRQDWERFGSELATLQGRLDRLEQRIHACEAARCQGPVESTGEQRGAGRD